MGSSTASTGWPPDWQRPCRRSRKLRNEGDMKEPVGLIRISGGGLHIRHHDYSTANISRVQTFRLAWRGKLATSSPVARIALLLALIGVTALAASALPAARLRIDASIIATARTAGEILTLIAGARI